MLYLNIDGQEVLVNQNINSESNEMSIKEIAEILDLSSNNVSVRIHRALERLKKILDEYYEF